MKATGIVRKIDPLGRLVLPIEIRRVLDINEKDAMEIFIEGDSIILKKYAPGCVFCGNVGEGINFKGKIICKACSNTIKVI